MKKKLLLISLIFLIPLFFISLSYATDIKLNDGTILKIPDEYKVSYKNYEELSDNPSWSGIPSVEADNCSINFYPHIMRKTSYKEKIDSIPKEYKIINQRVLKIGSKEVTEILAEMPTLKGYPMSYIYVDNSNETLGMPVMVYDWKDWNIEKKDNPVHKIIETLNF